MPEAGVGAADLGWKILAQLGEPFDVQLVDDAAMQRMRGGESERDHFSFGSITTDRGTNGALSSVFGSLVADPSRAMT